MRPSLSSATVALLHQTSAAADVHGFALLDDLSDPWSAHPPLEVAMGTPPTCEGAATGLAHASPTPHVLIASPKIRGTEEHMAAKKTSKKATPKKAKSAKKGAQGSPKAKFGAKSEFIRSQPADMPAKQVVEAAKQAGLTLSENLVYATRAEAKKKTVAKGPAPSSAGKRKPGRPRGSTSKPSDLDAQLRTIVAEMGLARARTIFSEVEAAFSGR